MTPEQRQFIKETRDGEIYLDKYPAWAKSEGIKSVAEWRIVLSLFPFDWPTRHDKLAELKAKIEHVLQCWDDMAKNYDN